MSQNINVLKKSWDSGLPTPLLGQCPKFDSFLNVSPHLHKKILSLSFNTDEQILSCVAIYHEVDPIEIQVSESICKYLKVLFKSGLVTLLKSIIKIKIKLRLKLKVLFKSGLVGYPS